MTPFTLIKNNFSQRLPLPASREKALRQGNAVSPRKVSGAPNISPSPAERAAETPNVDLDFDIGVPLRRRLHATRGPGIPDDPEVRRREKNPESLEFSSENQPIGRHVSDLGSRAAIIAATFWDRRTRPACVLYSASSHP